MKPTIAYVDDDIQNLKLYRELLSGDFDIETYSRSLDLTDALAQKNYDCFILDIYMPVLDGFQLFEKIRNRPEHSKTPIFFITTNPHDEVKISSYKKGAADFFDRMVKKEELVARLESRIKDFRKNSSSLKIGNLSVDLNQIDCHLDGKKLILTLLEFKVLSKLMQAFPHKVSKDELVRSIWGEDKISANNINTHLYNLRLKIADWSHAIENHRAQGFWIDSKVNK